VQHLSNLKDLCVADKIILTDCDGVLLDWETTFAQWIGRQGYKFNPNNDDQYSINARYNIPHGQGSEVVDEFNHSSEFEYLEPWRDAVQYVKQLAADGWRFVVITTAGSHPLTYELRLRNLEKVFGKDVFKSLHVLPLHSNKGVELEKYKDSGLYWIEDKPGNADLGLEYGLRPLLMTAPYNLSYNGAVPRVNNWKEIYSIVTSYSSEP
jgi:uncharacterized HAD superfamily protein